VMLFYCQRLAKPAFAIEMKQVILTRKK